MYSGICRSLTATLVAQMAMGQSIEPRQSGNYTYTVQVNDTIFSIASAANRSVCDIARASRLIDAEYIVEGWELIIPTTTYNDASGDDDSCLLRDLKPTATCVVGGPHVYTSIPGDTLTIIAQNKLNITLDSLLDNLGYDDSYANITSTEGGDAIKLPLCSPSQCTVKPYQMVNKTFADVAAEFGVSVGQIMGFNYGYTHSNHTADDSPILTVPVECRLLSNNITVVS